MDDHAGFLFLGAGSPWVYALADALARDGHPTLAVAPYDALTYRRLQPRWPSGEPAAELKRETWVLPPGYTGALAWVFAPVLRWKLGRALTRLRAGKGSFPWVVTPYPWFGPTVADVPATRLIYFNYDDYTLFRPERAARVLRLERTLLRRATLTLCSSRRQTESLRSRCPEKAEVIRHFPHGVIEKLFNQNPAQIPCGRTVGYVGNLSDRVDWRLVEHVAESMPETTFVFVGGLDATSTNASSTWAKDRATALGKPNVRHVGPVRQENVGREYASFAVNWIPYVVDHLFNQACCPTKIMDGLASGRPLLSTDLPECRLYKEQIPVARSNDEMVALLRATLAVPEHAAREQALTQVRFARNHTWQARARILSRWITALE